MKKIGSAFLLFSFVTASFAKTYEMKVTENGFEPASLNVSKNENIVLKITRLTDSTCATKIQVPSLKVSKELPLNKSVEMNLGKLKVGEVRFGCGMGMMIGGIITTK